ncbi:hypothetical protein SEPCBS119000_001110 [Sporothrix epigloea]|uniref:DUF1753-domain-containing protein n=1 Tax=Sporothrix epigloea TaxID=1892477 RepID=A0ABP0D9X9_9PEZI
MARRNTALRLLHTLSSLRPRLARPNTFLGFIPLRMGTEIISGILFFNKLTSAYGLLAILTGYSLSFIQLSAYFYNVAVLLLLAICIPHIRRETPLPNLALAWAYTIDTIINAAYTATFAIRWYVALNSTVAAATATASAVVAATNATLPSVSATATAAASVASAASLLALRAEDSQQMTATLPGSEATTVQSSSSPVPTAGSGGFMGAHEAAASLTLIVLVTVVRFYFSFTVIAHTRQVLQRYGDHVAEAAATANGSQNDEDNYSGAEESAYSSGGKGDKQQNGALGGHKHDNNNGEGGHKAGPHSARGRRYHRRGARPTFNSQQYSRRLDLAGSINRDPFALGSPAGEGWKGKLGRALVGVGRGFWLGRQRSDDWTHDVHSRFRSPSSAV